MMLDQTQGQKRSHMKSDNRHNNTHTQIINKCFFICFTLKQSDQPAASLERNFSSFLKHERKIAKNQADVNPKAKESVKSTLALGCWPDAKAITSKCLLN
jgi:hypothetical protein